MTNAPTDPGSGEIAALFAPGKVVGGQYRVLRMLNDEGGMGITYIAHDTELERDVVLKTLRSHLLRDEDHRGVFLKRFRQEAVLAARVTHRAIIPIYRYGEHEGVLWYAMEYITNSTSLRDRIEEYGYEGKLLPEPDLRRYFLDAAAGLAAIHEVGAVHRDIKENNLLVYDSSEGPALKILDFGIAHVEDSELTRTGHPMGTPLYLPPEYIQAMLALEKPEVTPRTDLFALGVTFYRALTGNRPFGGKTWPDISKSILKDRPAPPTSLREELAAGWDAMVMRLLHKNPDNRYQSATELYEDIQRLEDLPAYEAPANDHVASPVSASSAEVTRPDRRLPAATELPQMDEASVPEAVPAAAHAEDELTPTYKGSAPIESDPPKYANRPPPTGRFASLPRRARLGLGLLVLVALVILALVLARSSSSPVASGPILNPDDAKERPKQLTAQDLLREQDEAAREKLLADQRSAAAEPKEGAIKDAARSPRRAKTRRRVPGAKLASSTTPMPAPPPPPPSEGSAEPRRKDASAIVSFPDGPAASAPAGAAAPLGIPTGTMIDAQLKTPVSSTAPNTLVTATVTRALSYPGRGTVIPKGTKVFGKATFGAQAGVGRVEVRFNRMVFPDRTERAVQAIAVTRSGEAGLVASVRKRDGRAGANAAEGALDVVDDVLAGTPVDKSAGRYSKDARSDARAGRTGTTVISVPARTRFKIQFTKSPQ